MAHREQLTAVAVAMALVFAACGAEEEPKPSGRDLAGPIVKVERAANRAPSIVSLELVPAKPKAGDPIEAHLEAADPDGDGVRVEYEWFVNGNRVEGESKPLFKTLDVKKGDRIELRVVATDGLLESETVRKAVKIGNQPPRLQGVSFSGAAVVRAGDPIDASPVASDPDGDELTFTYKWFVNDKAVANDGRQGSRFDTTGLERGDRVEVEVGARDRSDETEPVRSAVVRIGNTPPKIEGIPPVQSEGGNFTYAFKATDADGDRTLRFSLSEAPRGMTIDAATGVAQWRPEASQAGRHPVEVVVTDGFGDGGALRFEVVVGTEGETPPAAQGS